VPIIALILTYLYFTIKNSWLKSEWTRELTRQESGYFEKIRSYEMENILLDERLKQAISQIEIFRFEYEHEKRI
jgi:hypothetical protein